MENLLVFVIVVLLAKSSLGDIYMHSPRGSNNRLNERSATRANNNRLFDSQNNARGGYNVGDKGSTASTSESQQYNMKYFYSTASGGTSDLHIEWTNQHGCGGNEVTDPHKQNCQVVVQYMCQADGTVPTIDRLRNGQSTQTQNYNRNNPNKGNSVKSDRGLHESFDWYRKCDTRDRNMGIFTADQRLVGNRAIYTRQNPNGNRRGYECPEERDYYPYWHPTPWKDIAILTDDTSKCSFYRSESFNVRSRGECTKDTGDVTENRQESCEARGGTWRQFYQYLEKMPERTEATCKSEGNIKLAWALPWDAVKPYNKECLVLLGQPDCKSAPWTRSNHLGDARGVKGFSNYTWRLPYFPSGRTHRCVLRLRYNISTDDYDPWTTTAFQNLEHSPIRQNPLVPVGVGRSPLRLAINTAQTGRTFQDRTHVFLMAPRPSEVSQTAPLLNLNVRGKRGNIVQVYPAVEYDFVPNRLSTTPSHLVHIQWTGSNSHNNGNPAGDGQAGNDGQGTEGTDRTNLVEIPNPDRNFPTPFEYSRFWKPSVTEVVWSGLGSISNLDLQDFAIQLASSGYYQCLSATKCSASSVESKGKMNSLLNNAPASFPGLIFRMKAKGTYHYMCSRNNNFSNRSQKGFITVL